MWYGVGDKYKDKGANALVDWKSSPELRTFNKINT